LLVGFLNTIYVAVCGIITATISASCRRRAAVEQLADPQDLHVYVELFRNIPPLLVIFFWYFGVLAVLPLPRDIDRPAVRLLSEQPWLLLARNLGRGRLADRRGLLVGIVLAGSSRAGRAPGRWRPASNSPSCGRRSDS
jgi:general L-amino acid transport system permease protein